MLLPRTHPRRKSRHLWLALFAVIVGVCFGGPPASTRTTNETSSEPAIISGRVTLDGQPLSGIVVTATIRIGSYGGGETVARATTGFDGRYAFAALPPGEYFIRPLAPTLVVIKPESTNRRDDLGFKINLAANANPSPLNFELQKGGVITGRVTDANGNPVPGYRVVLMPLSHERPLPNEPPFVRKPPPPPPNNTGPKLFPSGIPDRIPPGAPPQPVWENIRGFKGRVFSTTDDRGIYRAYGLPPGRYVVGVSRIFQFPLPPDNFLTREFVGPLSGRYTAFYPDIYFPATADVNEAGLVEIASGQQATEVNLKLGPVEYLSLRTIRGKLSAGDGIGGLHGADISATRIDPGNVSDWNAGFTSRSDKADETGNFVLAGLAPGRYRITGRRSGQANTVFPPVEVEIKDEDANGVILTAKPGLTVSGKLVVDPPLAQAAPVAWDNYTLMLMSFPEDSGGATWDEIKPNPDGTFVAVGLDPGRVQFRLYSGPTDLSVSSVVRDGVSLPAIIPGRDPKEGGFILEADRSVENVVVHTAYPSRQLSVTVLREGGEWPTDTYIGLDYYRVEGGSRGWGQPLDRTGRFTLKDLLPGKYQLEVRVIIRSGPEAGSYQTTTTAVVTKPESDTVVYVNLPERR